MKSKLLGLTTGQSTPTAGTLQIYPEGRYEDGQGNATPGRYDFVLNGVTQSWRDKANPEVDAYIVTAGPGEPAAIRAMFLEQLTYADGRTVSHTYWKWLRTTNLDATQFAYTAEQDVRGYEGREPITMAAARELLIRGGAQVEEIDAALQGMENRTQTALADIAQSQAALADAIATIGVINTSVTGLAVTNPQQTAGGNTYYTAQAAPDTVTPVTVSATSGGNIYYLPGGTA